MRDVKFRVYDEGRMKYPEEYKENRFDNYFIDLNGQLRYYQNCYDGGFFDTDNAKLMQFTGIHDENEKEIYEGDIVKFKHRDKTIIALVKYGEWQESKCDEYDCPHYGYYIDYKWDNYCENTGFDLYEKIVEVVGNIYENPELLKGADNIE